MKGNVLAAVALWFMGCLNASAASMASRDVGVRLRLMQSAHVLPVVPAWPGLVQAHGASPGLGFGAVDGSPQQALVALSRFAQTLPGVALETRPLNDGWEAWAFDAQGCAHVLGRQVQGPASVVTRIEVRACTKK